MESFSDLVPHANTVENGGADVSLHFASVRDVLHATQMQQSATPSLQWKLVAARCITIGREAANMARNPYLPGSIAIDMRDIEEWNAYSKENPSRFSSSTDARFTNPSGKLRSVDYLQSFFASRGIFPSTSVIVYKAGGVEKDPDPIVAARLAFALLVAGVKSVKVLNGGYDAWVDRQLPVCNECMDSQSQIVAAYVPKPHDNISPSGVLALDMHASLVATAEDIVPLTRESNHSNDVASIASNGDDGICNAVVADVRAWEEYTGQRHDYEYMKRLGRITGCVSKCNTDLDLNG
eukprot:m.267099 g.267099  ORF g.267099 m.267099 type:complete len:294 (-) comp19724_c0_seq1:365-1246(-)